MTHVGLADDLQSCRLGLKVFFWPGCCIIKAFDYEVIGGLGWMGLELYEKLAENLMNEFQEFPGIHIQYATFVEK